MGLVSALSIKRYMRFCIPFLLFLTTSNALSAPTDGIVSWSATDKDTNISLSNNDLTASIADAAGAGAFGMRSSHAIEAGEGFYYFEIEQLQEEFGFAVGVATSTVPLNTSDDVATFIAANPTAGVLSDTFVGKIGVAVDYRGANPTIYFVGNDVFLQQPDAVASISTAVTLDGVTDPVYIYAIGGAGGEYRLNFGGENGADFDWDPVTVLSGLIFNIESILSLGWPVPQADPSIAITEGGQLVAQNGSITFNATATDSSSADISSSVNWFLDGVSIGSGSSISPSTTSPGIYTLKAQVSDSIGLTSSVSVGYYVHPSTGGAALDEDMDGLNYTQELAAGTDPGNHDSDGDGLSDGYEVANSSNPLVVDTPISIEAHQEQIAFTFEPTLTSRIVTVSDDGLEVGYLPVGGKAAIRANQGMQGEFRYWEGQAFFDADMGFGLVNPDENLDDYCCVDADPTPAGSSMSVNTAGNNSIWRNLLFQGGYVNNDEYLGFAVDYRSDDPIVYVIGSSGLQFILTLSDYPSDDPIFPMMYGNAGEVEDASRVASAIQRGNFGHEPFFYDVETILANATDEGTPLNIDVSDLVPGWGKYRQLQHLNLDVLDQTVDFGDSVTINGVATDALGDDNTANISWTIIDSDNNDVTDDVASTAPPITGASITFTTAAATTYRVVAQITDSKTGQAFTRTSLVTSNPAPETDPPVFTTSPEDITVSIISGTSVPASNEQIQTFLNSAEATDASGTPTISNDAPSNFPVGDTTVTFTAEDVFANQATVTAVVTVAVTGQIPVITVPDGGITVELASGNSLSSSDSRFTDFVATVSASDVEDGDVTSSITNNAPASFPVGATTVTFSVTDSQSNTGTATATITITDGGAPTITAVDDITLNSASGADIPASNAAIVSFLTSVTASDDVDGSVTVSNDAPASFPVGLTYVTFSATDTANNAASPFTAIVRVLSETLGSTDSDGDDISDADEGAGDDDGDRIPNYLDSSADMTQLPISDDEVIQVSPGVEIILGEVAFAAGSANGSVTITDIMDYGDGGSSVVNGDDTNNYLDRIVDFEIRNVPLGTSVDLVIPQVVPIPQGAVYRKYTSSQGWVNYGIDVNNSVSSAASSAGVCPGVSDPAYTTGLTAGHDCVRLRIQDGGPNDADGTANGVIKDPSGVAVEVSTTVQRSSVSTQSSFNEGSGEQLVLSFEMINNTGDAVINSFRFATEGDMDEVNDISLVSLYIDADLDGVADGSAIATGTYSVDDGTIEFTFSSPLPLAIGTTQFLVYYIF